MSARKKRALGRGMSDLVGSPFGSIVEPVAGARPQQRPGEGNARRIPVARPAAPEPGSRPTAPAPPSGPAPTALAAPPEPGLAGAARSFDVVSITSGKGGTGKSVLASNLGVLLAPGTRVTILDADLGLANIHILYNLQPRFNASHVIAGEKRLDEITLDGPRGVRLIPGGSGIPELASLTDLMFGSLASGIATLDGQTDLLLIDTPSGIDRQSLLFLLASDQILVVTTEDVTAMTDAYAVIKTVLTRRPASTVVVVVNQARSFADGLETFHKIAHVCRKFLGRELALGGVIPFDEAVERSVAARLPVALGDPAGPAARAMASIAGRIGTFHSRSPRAGQPFTDRLRGLISSPLPPQRQAT